MPKRKLPASLRLVGPGGLVRRFFRDGQKAAAASSAITSGQEPRPIRGFTTARTKAEFERSTEFLLDQGFHLVDELGEHSCALFIA